MSLPLQSKVPSVRTRPGLSKTSSSPFRVRLGLRPGAKDLEGAGCQGGDEAGGSLPPDPGLAPTSTQVPQSGVPGFGFGARARGSRQVSAPDAPLNPPRLSAKTHSPSFYGVGKAGARDPYSGKRLSGGGQADSHALFGAAALGAALYCRWGPRERRAGDGRASAAASSPPRPVPQDCSWH